MIGVIEFKYDEKGKPIPVGVGNAKKLARGTSIQAVRSADGNIKSAVDTGAVSFTVKGILSNSDANWDQLRYGYLRYASNLLQGDDLNCIQDTSKFSVRTFNTVAELTKYLNDCGVSFKNKRPQPVVAATPELTLTAGEYSMSDILTLATKLAGDQAIVSGVKVRVGQPADDKTERLTNDELRAAFQAIMDALPTAAAQRVLDKAMENYKVRVNNIFQKIRIKAPKTNFSVTVTKK